jgi:hypothetical protein
MHKSNVYEEAGWITLKQNSIENTSRKEMVRYGRKHRRDGK